MPTITGTGEPDLIEGLGGDDIIVGGGGADTLRGGDGDDRIIFQAGTNPPTLVEGGAGLDTLDFSGYDSSRFPDNLLVTIRAGTIAGANALSASTTSFNGTSLVTSVLTEATGIERLVLGQGTDINLSNATSTFIIDSHLSTGQRITGGQNNDTISITLRNDATAQQGYQVAAGAGQDALIITGAAADYLIQQIDIRWAIYHGQSGLSTFDNLETVRFGSGPSMSWQQATALDFDAAAYLSRYADLRAAFGTDQVKAFQHYQQYGKAEGRIATAFDGLSYIASYPDLISAFGTDAAAGAQHFLEYGAREGRTINFDGAAYADSHLDLARIIGTDTAAAAQHYITYGLNEGRTTAGFDSVAYLLSNAGRPVSGVHARLPGAQRREDALADLWR